MITETVRKAKSDLGKYLRGLRESLNVAPSVLAQKCDVKWNTIHRIEEGVGKYSASLVTRFIEALGVQVSRIFPEIQEFFEVIFPKKSNQKTKRLRYRPELA